jgi:hypothetical protein
VNLEYINGGRLYGSQPGVAGSQSLAGYDPARLVQRILAGQMNLSGMPRAVAEQGLAYLGNMQQPPEMADIQRTSQRIAGLDDRALLAALVENDSELSSLGYNVPELRRRLGDNRQIMGQMPAVDESLNVDASYPWNDESRVNRLRQDIGRTGIESLLPQESDPWLRDLNNPTAQVLSRRNPGAIAVLGATAAAQPSIGSNVVPGALQLPSSAVKNLVEARDLGPAQVNQAVGDLLSGSDNSIVRAMASGISQRDFQQLMDSLRQNSSPEAQQLYRTLQQLSYTKNPQGLLAPVGVGGRRITTWPNIGTTSPILNSAPNLPQLVQEVMQSAATAEAAQGQRAWTARGPNFAQAYLPPISEYDRARALERLETGEPRPAPELSDRQRFSASTYPGNQRTLSSDELADMAFSPDPETRGTANEQFEIRSAAADRRLAGLGTSTTAPPIPPTVGAAVGRIGDPNSDIRGNLDRQAQALANRFQGAAISPPPRNTIDVPDVNDVDFRDPRSVEQFVDLKLKQLLGPGLDAVPDDRRNTEAFRQLVAVLNDPNTSLVQNGRFNPPLDAQGRSLIDQVLPEHLGRAPIQKNVVSLIGSLDRLAGDTTVDDGRTVANPKLEWDERNRLEQLQDNPRSERRARMKSTTDLRQRYMQIQAGLGLIPMGEAPTTDSLVSYRQALRARRRGNSVGNQGAFSGSESQYFEDPNMEGFGYGADPADRRESRMTGKHASRLQRGGTAPMTAPKSRLDRLKLGANMLLFGNPEAAGFGRWSPEAVHFARAGERIGPVSRSPGESLPVTRSFTFSQLKEQGMSDDEINRLRKRTTDTGVVKYIVQTMEESPSRLQGLSTRSIGSGKIDAMLGLESENYIGKRLAPGKGGVRHRRAGEKFEARLGQIEQVNQTIVNLGKTSEGRKTLAQLESAISQGDSNTVRSILGQAGALTESGPTRKGIRFGYGDAMVVTRRGQPATKQRIPLVSDGKKSQTPGAFVEEVARREAGGDEKLLPSARQDARRRFGVRRAPGAKNTGEGVANRASASRSEREQRASLGQRPLPERYRMTEFERGTPDDDTLRLEQRTRAQRAIASQSEIKEVINKARKLGSKYAKKQGVPEASAYVFKQSELERMPQDMLRKLQAQFARMKSEVLVVDKDGKLSQFIKGGDVRKSGGDLTVKGKARDNEVRWEDVKTYLDSKVKNRRKGRREDGMRQAMNMASQLYRIGIRPENAEEMLKKYKHFGPNERLRLIRAIQEHARRNSKPSMGAGVARGVAKLVTRGKA